MELSICVDCATAAANNDYSGMDTDTETRVRAGLETVGYLIVDTDDYTEFSRWRCDCCRSHLAGSRYAATTA